MCYNSDGRAGAFVRLSSTSAMLCSHSLTDTRRWVTRVAGFLLPLSLSVPFLSFSGAGTYSSLKGRAHLPLGTSLTFSCRGLDHDHYSLTIPLKETSFWGSNAQHPAQADRWCTGYRLAEYGDRRSAIVEQGWFELVQCRWLLFFVHVSPCSCSNCCGYVFCR